MGDGLGVWDGNAIKLGCDDLCTTINVIKFIELKKKRKKQVASLEESGGGLPKSRRKE